jgi:hypothetical protein
MKGKEIGNSAGKEVGWDSPGIQGTHNEVEFFRFEML